MSSNITLNPSRGINTLIPFCLRNKYVAIGSIITAALITIALIANKLFSYLRTQDGGASPSSPHLEK